MSPTPYPVGQRQSGGLLGAARTDTLYCSSLVCLRGREFLRMSRRSTGFVPGGPFVLDGRVECGVVSEDLLVQLLQGGAG